jgi:hypothetical protein
MRLNSDLREFLELLNARGVDYVIVGAHSLAFHGRPRYTGDLDVLVRPSQSNAALLIRLLEDFGFSESKFALSDFVQPDQVVQLGRPPNRIDILTSLTGVSTEDALAGKIGADLHGVPTFVLSKPHLIQNKRAVGRPQDIADLSALE